MNYTRAVRLALARDQRGLDFLYQSTYQSKYYLALKYMGSQEAAEDVLQDSYVKAFSSLGSLANPEAFSGWLGSIVANTAKNALAKKSPEAFSEVMYQNEEGDDLEFQLEDADEAYQPERSYNKQEVSELVGQLVDVLPDDQRMCVLMYYYEGMSVADIALAMGCSENTVKSRLNYARKKMLAQAEDMQSRGYEFFAGVPALLWLLRTQEAGLAADGTIAAAGQVVASRLAAAGAGTAGTAGAVGATAEVAPTVTASTTAQQAVTASTTVQQAGATATSQAVTAGQAAAAGSAAAKGGILSSTAAKVVLAVALGCAVGGGAVFGISQAASTPTQEEEVVEEVVEEEDEESVESVVVEVVEEVDESEAISYPVGTWGYASQVGAVRIYFTIDEDGLMEFRNWSSGTGDGLTATYQASVDQESSTDEEIVYVFTYTGEGYIFENGEFDVSAGDLPGPYDDKIFEPLTLTYSVASNTFYDEGGTAYVSD